MAASSIVVNSITPNLYILGDNQKIFFSDPINNFSFINKFTPLSNVPTTLKIGIFNVFNNGYFFEHNTLITDNFGPLKLKSVFNNNSVDLLSIDNNIFTFNIPVIVPTPTLNNHATNKSYIDNKTWTISQITDFNSSVVAFKLDQFAIPTANINLNNNKIINLATPVLATDAANKSFVESSVSSGISGVPTDVTLTGDVSGSGNTGSSITTTLNKRLDQISLPTASVNFNSQNITNLATPTLASHAVNKSYLDSRTINDLTAPTDSFSMNSNRIINVANPISAQDVATRIYVDSIGGSVWTNYTPTVTCPTGNPWINPTLPSSEHYEFKCSYTIIGKTMLINFNLRLDTIGTSGYGLYLFSIPSGYSIDESVYSYDTSIITRNASINGSLTTDGYTSILYQTQVGRGIVRQGSAFSTDCVVSPVYGQNKLCLFGNFIAVTNQGFSVRNAYINSDFFMFTGDMPAVYKFNATIKIQ